MDTKALILDIDGTILNSKGVMTKKTYDALLECHRRGLFICIATARSGRLVFRERELPWEHAFLLERGIYYNGGTVFDNRNQFYQHIAIPGPIVQQAVSKVLEYDDTFQIALQHDDQYHSFRIPMPDDLLISWGFMQDELVNFQDAQNKPTTKIIVLSGTSFRDKLKDLSDLYELLVSQFSNSANVILADSRKAIYILSKYVNKGDAINTLISFYGIKPEEVAVFGDDTPDIGMFGMFGHSIAMGNAHESLKENATFVTKSNDEEGVVSALANYLRLI